MTGPTVPPSAPLSGKFESGGEHPTAAAQRRRATALRRTAVCEAIVCHRLLQNDGVPARSTHRTPDDGACNEDAVEVPRIRKVIAASEFIQTRKNVVPPSPEQSIS